MSQDEIELLRVRMEGRNELIKTLFGGLKDLLVVVASVATLYLQTANAGKLDVAAQASATNAAITTQWWAERTHAPTDIAKAEKAKAIVESIP